MMQTGVGVVLAVMAAAGMATATGFRGDGSGVYPDAKVSAVWNKDTKPVWQVKLPSWSNSSPLPVGDRVFVGNEPTILLCLRASDGTNLWEASLTYEETLSGAERQQLDAERKKEESFNALRKAAVDKLGEASRQVQNGKAKEVFGQQTQLLADVSVTLGELHAKYEPTPMAEKFRMPPAHGGTGYSTPTAVSDGKFVWAHGGNGVVACYSLDGQRKWIRFVEKPTQGHGHSSSPVLAGGKLIVAINGIHAFDAGNGVPAWQTNSTARFGTPVATVIGGQTVLVTPNGEIISAVDGKVLTSKLGGLSFSSPVVADGVVFFANDNEIRAYRLPFEVGESLAPVQLWKAAAPGGRIYASPVCYGGLLYVISDSGKLLILDAASGEKAKELALQLPGTCYSSPAMAGNVWIAGSEGGAVAAFEAGREGRELGRLKLDGIRSTPAIAGNRVYLRTMSGIACFSLGGQ
jgi:outer membrane protein assembly factor BamB